jgi:hypothetical protein
MYIRTGSGRQSEQPTEDTTVDELFDALSRAPRRRILAAFADGSSRGEDVFYLADLVPADAERDAFLTMLHHVHLPYLDDAGFVDWDRQSKTVRRGPKYDDIAPFIELAVSNQDDLPEGWQ